jgi:hypothetical protein
MKDNTISSKSKKKTEQTPEQTPKQTPEQTPEQQIKNDYELKLTENKNKLKITIIDELCKNELDSVVLSTILNIIRRAKVGREKYKNDMDRTDKDILGWLQDATEEALDKSLYLHKVGAELRFLIDNKKL